MVAVAPLIPSIRLAALAEPIDLVAYMLVVVVIMQEGLVLHERGRCRCQEACSTRRTTCRRIIQCSICCLQTCVNAVYAASFMALIAVGLMLIFGVMGVVNFRPRRAVHARRLLRGVRVRGPVVPLLLRGHVRAGVRRRARHRDGADSCSGRCEPIPWRG